MRQGPCQSCVRGPRRALELPQRATRQVPGATTEIDACLSSTNARWSCSPVFGFGSWVHRQRPIDWFGMRDSRDVGVRDLLDALPIEDRVVAAAADVPRAYAVRLPLPRVSEPDPGAMRRGPAVTPASRHSHRWHQRPRRTGAGAWRSPVSPPTASTSTLGVVS